MANQAGATVEGGTLTGEMAFGARPRLGAIADASAPPSTLTSITNDGTGLVLAFDAAVVAGAAVTNPPGAMFTAGTTTQQDTKHLRVPITVPLATVSAIALSDSDVRLDFDRSINVVAPTLSNNGSFITATAPTHPAQSAIVVPFTISRPRPTSITLDDTSIRVNFDRDVDLGTPTLTNSGSFITGAAATHPAPASLLVPITLTNPTLTAVVAEDTEIILTFNRTLSATGIVPTNNGGRLVAATTTQPAADKVSVPVTIAVAPEIQTVSAGANVVTVTFDVPVALAGGSAVDWVIEAQNGAAAVLVTSVEVSGPTVTLHTTEHTDGGEYELYIPVNEVFGVGTGIPVVNVTGFPFFGVGTAPTVTCNSIGPRSVTVMFSEPVSPNIALDKTRYVIPDLEVLAVQRVSAREYRLTTSEQNPGTIYSLTVTGVTDLAKNPV